MITSDLIARYYSLSIWSLFEKLSFHDNKWQQRSLYHRPSLNLTITNYITFLKKINGQYGWVFICLQMILTSLQGRRLIGEIWTQKIGSSHFVWDACQDFSPSETKGFTNEFGEHLLWQHTQNSILVLSFLGSAVVPEIW